MDHEILQNIKLQGMKDALRSALTSKAYDLRKLFESGVNPKEIRGKLRHAERYIADMHAIVGAYEEL